MLGVSKDTVRRLFADEPGVIDLGRRMATRGKRRYRVLRIPAAVLNRVMDRKSVKSLDRGTQMHVGETLHDNSAMVATLDVCQHAENSVTLCPCGKPAKKKFCCGACRQAAYRKSTAHTDNLKRLRDARTARKNDYIALKNASYKRLNAHRGFTQQTGIYGGPAASGVPSVRIGDLDLNDYLPE